MNGGRARILRKFTKFDPKAERTYSQNPKTGAIICNNPERKVYQLLKKKVTSKITRR